ncbi:MAG: hypothetical protein DMG36_17670 [Acidobacteria bacterium]|nr:MAG: hypothetical protein DMG36_17670 [Acidobacteriota bacterium]
MRKLVSLLLFEAVILLILIPIFSRNPSRSVIAQSTFPDPANEHACPSQTGAGGGAEAIPAFVGPGTDGFSPNQSLCLPQLAPVPSGSSPLAFIVGGAEPGDRVDSQGTIYVESIRGVPGGVDLWRWNQSIDGAPNANGTLPFKYEGQPDNCGIFGLTGGGCVNNVGSPTNLGLAPGGGDADIAVNAPDPNNSAIPNLAFTSLTLAPGVTATNSRNRGDTFFTPPNVVAALVPGDDRMWNDAVNDASTVYLAYHDLATFNINVQRSNNGGLTYTAGLGEAIDAATLPAAGSLAPTSSANTAAQIKVDNSSCPSRGNLYVAFTAPDNAIENANTGPQRSVYVGVSTDAGLGAPTFTFTDHKVFTSPLGSQGATHGNNNIFPALAVDSFGNAYTVWSDNQNIFLSSSSNLGVTWTSPVRVNSGPTVNKSNVFPWVAADANGHVVVTWLGSSIAGNSNDVATMQPACADGTTDCWAQWNVYAAESVNGTALVPSFTQHAASDHIIHSGTICTSGTGCSGDDSRSLADFFQVALDPQHRANIAYADDHLASPLCSQQTPGHCANNDPQSFRQAVPYFTYQIKPNKKVITTGLCAR